MITQRKVLITGATGYVGSALAPAIAQRYPVVSYCLEAFGNSIASAPNIQFIQGDIRDTLHLRKALEGVTDVIWLASIVTDELVDLNVAKGREVNVTALEHGLDACVEAGVHRFLLMSSSSVYGATDTPSKETDEPKPMTAYAQSKLDQEVAIWPYQNRMTVCAIRSATLCGPAPRMRGDTIVNVFSKQAYFDRSINVWGGDQWRSNVHVRDVVDLYLTLLEAPAVKINGEVFNLTASNYRAIDIASKVRAILEAMGHPCRVTVDASKGDDRHYKMDASKLQERLGWHTSRTIEDAVIDNLRWFRDGGMPNPDDDIWYNTRRMAAFMKEA